MPVIGNKEDSIWHSSLNVLFIGWSFFSTVLLNITFLKIAFIVVQRENENSVSVVKEKKVRKNAQSEFTVKIHTFIPRNSKENPRNSKSHFARATLSWIAEYIPTFVAIFHKYISFFRLGSIFKQTRRSLPQANK